MLKRLLLGLGALFAVLVVVAVVAAAVVLWHPAVLRGTIERLASEQVGAPVRIAGPLNLELGQVTVAEVRKVEIAAPDWASSPTFASVERLRIGVDLGAWFRDGRIVLTELQLDAPKVVVERDAEGRANWPAGPAASNESATESSPPPEIRSLVINDGAVTYKDVAAQAELDVRIATGAPVAGGEFGGLRVEGQGTALGQPVQLDFEIGSPLLLATRDAPLPITGKLESGSSQLSVDGKVRDALAMDGLDLDLVLDSADPAPLLALAGRRVAQGQLPPLRAHARLTADGAVFAASGLSIDWGETHATGELNYAASEPRPRFEGRLHALLIDVVALHAAIESAPPAPPGSTDTQLAPGPLATHDGSLELTIDRIRLPNTEISEVAMTVQLQDGRLVADPLRLTLPQGGVAGRLTFDDLDAGSFAGETRLAAKGIDLATLAPAAGASGSVTAELAGRLAGADLAGLLRESDLRLTGRAENLVLPQLGSKPSSLVFTAVTAGTGERPVEVRIDGEIAGETLAVAVKGGPLDALLAQPVSYPLGFSATLGDSRAELDGTLAWPLTAGGLDMAVSLASQDLDLSAVAPVTGRLTGTAEGRLQGGSLGEILARSRLDLKGELTQLRLPQLGERMPRAAFDAQLQPGTELPLRAKLTGTVEGKPLEIRAEGGAVADLSGRADYPVHLAAVLDQTKADARGTVAWPLDRNGLHMTLSVAGPDPAEVLRLLELPEITLPPYDLRAQVQRDGAAWRLKGLSGRVGDSDVAGDIAVDLGGERHKVDGSLHSKVLDLDDLLGLVGAEPGTGPGETASGKQKAEARTKAKDDEVLPDQRFDPESWRALDIAIGLKADQVKAGILPMDSFDLKVALKNGRLNVDPLVLRLGDGRIDGKVAVDGNKRPAAAQMEMDLVRLPVGRLLQRLNVDTAGFGTLSGRARGAMGVAGRGSSVAEILGNADGEVTLMMEGGKINGQLVHLLGFDFLNVLGSVLGVRSSGMNMNCTLADLAIKDGKVSTRALVLDTDAASLAGDGTIDLGSETIDLELLAQPKGSPLPSGKTGVKIVGKLAEPEISFDAGRLVARGAAAATFGVLLRPFTALASSVLPTSEAAKNTGTCAKLMQRKPADAG